MLHVVYSIGFFNFYILYYLWTYARYTIEQGSKFVKIAMYDICHKVFSTVQNFDRNTTWDIKEV